MERGRGIRGLKRLVAVLFVLALLLILAAVFQANTIDVYGNTYHSQEDIAEGLSGNIITGNTLYIMWKYRNGSIPDSLPYLNSLHVEMKSPSHIVAEVTEKSPVACIETAGYVYFDNEGMVLDISETAYDNIPLVTGVAAGESSLYQKVQVESSSQLRTILSLVQLLKDQGMTPSEIRFSDNMEITVYIDGVEAEMGQDEYLEEKVANLNKIIPRLEGQKGILHLESFTGRNETVSFSPSNSDTTIDDVANKKSDEMQDGINSEEKSAAEGEDDSDVDQKEDQTVTIPMVFDSSGTLVYNVHISNGMVVDAYGSQVPGCYVNEDGNVVDAYMNVLSSETGELVQ